MISNQYPQSPFTNGGATTTINRNNNGTATFFRTQQQQPTTNYQSHRYDDNDDEDDYNRLFETPKIKRQPHDDNVKYPIDFHEREVTKEELLTVHLETLKKETTLQQSAIKETNDKYQEALKTIDKLQAEVKAMTQDKSQRDQEMSELKHLLNIQADKWTQLRNYSNEQSDVINKQSNTISECHQQIHTSREQISDLIRARTALIIDLDNAKSDLLQRGLQQQQQMEQLNITSTAGQYRAKIDELSNKLMIANDTIKKLTMDNNNNINSSSTLNGGASKRKDGPMATTSASINELEEENQWLTKELNDLRIKYNQLVSDHNNTLGTINDVEMVIEAITKENTNLKSERESLLNDTMTLNGKLANQEEQYMSFKQQMYADQRERRTSDESMLDQSKRELIEIVRELSAIKQQLKKLDQSLGFRFAISGNNTNGGGRSMYNSNNNNNGNGIGNGNGNGNGLNPFASFNSSDSLVDNLQKVHDEILSIKQTIMNQQYYLLRSAAS
ncbi:hypothetical protein SAMD00019534_077120 [Acytostelium subglobosum LB1]|uniref:hypothetical protein n=1 Tax=Acytostelium subglobosum LB1 TaxID=1410327 RepID=UPI000644A22D|nr:hypothetical protein SAMD00019534_077120 [Acytostelium subglobosum LB1]GAM24537.1 hypothetical protein SAMD00019534_077120 [Acytostelium subglobosum LB1]|eukprot:XP_012752863.1 hypothetical protein SAMD00019534_077120 [Acytostelium subglobosum LB1]